LAELVAVQAPGVAMALPELVGEAGQDAAYRTLEFFTSCIPNPNTRDVYGQAVRELCAFCTRLGVPLEHVPSPTLAAWVQAMAFSGHQIVIHSWVNS
jgi:hypothetical protein